MKQEINKTVIALVFGVIFVAIAGGAIWMWSRPAAVSANSPPIGTPESAAAMRQRGRQMRDDFMASHRKGRGQGNTPSESSSD